MLKRAAGLLCLCLLAGCGGDAGAQAEEPLTAEDLGTTAEARAYIREGGMVWTETVTREELERFIRDLYGAGAPRVLFAGIEKLGGRDLTAWLVVKLPRAGRKAIFDAFNEVVGELEQGKVEDTGQEYLDLPLD